MPIGDDKALLRPMETYFIPVGINHNWKTVALSARISDVVAKLN